MRARQGEAIKNRMKIAFDATVLHGRKSGVGYYCEELFKAMVAMDHETEFFVFSHQPLQLELPSSNGNIRLAKSRFCPVRAFYLHALLPKLLSKEKPDLCHFTNFLGPITASAPYVVTVHDMGLERLRSAHPLAKRVYTRPLVPRIANGARLVITNSEYSKWEIVRYLGISPDRIRVTPLAASPHFHPVAESDRTPVLRHYGFDAPYVLYVGNLEPRKNLARLLEAFASLSNKEHELVIVGNSWYRGSDTVALVRTLGIAPRVRFLGYVPREHLPALYSGAAAFAYPSLLEGFGLPVIEAMACGTPVITSDNSALKEIAGDAAMLVDPLSVSSIRQALTDVTGDSLLRSTLAQRGLTRAQDYSWNATAALTLQAYKEARAGNVAHIRSRRAPAPAAAVADAIRRTVAYCSMFQYPLRIEELHERLFDVETDIDTVDRRCREMALRRVGDFIAPNPDFVSMRHFRETVSDRAIEGIWPHLETLAGMPFVRMIAFSGATAHRNMANREDVDLFVIIEDGKLWATFLVAVLWAKAKGLRQRLCVNYLLSDRALPLFDHDPFTAQQAASLKPIFGKAVYDEFIRSNPFVQDQFPNFDAAKHRGFYPEIHISRMKTALEALLRCGPVQVLERLARPLLRRYLESKLTSDADVVLDARRLKLHLHSHKAEVLREIQQSGTRHEARRCAQGSAHYGEN